MSRGCPPRPENLFYALLKLQDKIDQMTTLVRRPTEVRLDERMLEDFKRQVMVAQVQNPRLVLRKTADNLYVSPALARLPWLEHGFGVRGSENWLEGRPAATLQQVHSAVVIEARACGPAGEGDALTTDGHGLWIAVRTADCYPVILADERRRAVAMVHAGWRGTAAEIVKRTVHSMEERYGTRAGDLVAAVGPGIGGCCYEVGSEVAEKFKQWSGVCLKTSTQAFRLDLAGALVRQLREAGVPGDRIEAGGLCTFCGGGEFCSYRREGSRGGTDGVGGRDLIIRIGITGGTITKGAGFPAPGVNVEKTSRNSEIRQRGRGFPRSLRVPRPAPPDGPPSPGSECSTASTAPRPTASD